MIPTGPRRWPQPSYHCAEDRDVGVTTKVLRLEGRSPNRRSCHAPVGSAPVDGTRPQLKAAGGSLAGSYRGSRRTTRLRSRCVVAPGLVEVGNLQTTQGLGPDPHTQAGARKAGGGGRPRAGRTADPASRGPALALKRKARLPRFVPSACVWETAPRLFARRPGRCGSGPDLRSEDCHLDQARRTRPWTAGAVVGAEPRPYQSEALHVASCRWPGSWLLPHWCGQDPGGPYGDRPSPPSTLSSHPLSISAQCMTAWRHLRRARGIIGGGEYDLRP